MSTDPKRNPPARTTEAFGTGVEPVDDTGSLRMLEAPLGVRVKGTHDVYELIAANPLSGVLQVTLPLRPPQLGERIVLEVLEPGPPVHLMVEVTGPSRLPCTPDTRFVDVRWLLILATRRRSYLARALEEVLGIKAHLRTDDDELGPQRRLIYDVAAQQIRLVGTGDRALEESLLDGRAGEAAADPMRQTQPSMLVETFPDPRAPDSRATSNEAAARTRHLVRELTPSPPSPPAGRPPIGEPTPPPTAGRRTVHPDEPLFTTPVTLREPEPAAPGHPWGPRSTQPPPARHPTQPPPSRHPTQPPPGFEPPRHPTRPVSQPGYVTPPPAARHPTQPPPDTRPGAVRTPTQPPAARSATVTLDGTTGQRRPMFERDPALGFFIWRGVTLTMSCGWVGHSHVIFVVPSVEAIRVGETLRAALPGDPIVEGHVEVTGVVSRVRPDGTGQLMVELDIAGHARMQGPEYRRLVQFWAVRQRS